MKRLLSLFVIGILAVIVAACGSDNNNSGDSTNNANNANNEEDQTVVVTHELGETEVPKNPETVVVFDFGILDTLDKLDIEVAGIAQGNIPSYLEKYNSDEYENIGSLKEPDFEKISEIDPDVIIISGRQGPMYDELSELCATIHLGVDNERYMESFTENMEVIGEIFGKEDEIAEELSTIEESIDELNEVASASGKNSLIILANDDKISAYGPNSRFGIIHDVFGVPAIDETIEVSTHGANVTFEYVVEEDPDLLYVIDRGAAIGDESSAQSIIDNPLMQQAKSYPDDVHYLDPDFWYLSGGGLVSLAEMIKQIEESLE